METLRLTLTLLALSSLLLYRLFRCPVSLKWGDYRKKIAVIPFLGRFGIIRGYDAAFFVITSYMWWFVFCVLPLSPETQVHIVAMKTVLGWSISLLFFIVSYLTPTK